MNVRWEPMSINSPPPKSGIYAIKADEQWLYIGRSTNIAHRIKSKTHPVQITKDITSLSLSYQWAPVSQNLGSVEHALIALHQPKWNGGTSFDCTKEPRGPYCNILMPLTAANRILLLAAISLAVGK